MKSIPEAKVLYVSGYTDTSVVQNGFLKAGTEFLKKPFHSQTLVSKVRMILDRPSDK